VPELPLCIVCRKPIDKDAENYVVTNKDQAKYEDQWTYAHADCLKTQ
jgi:hypothetical protein